MAEFDTKCPHCNAIVTVEDDWVGLEVECPECKQSFTVEEATFTFICPECGTQAELPISFQGKKYECKGCCDESIAEPATEKKCPHCGETIKFNAKICKFCKKSLDSPATNTAKQAQQLAMKGLADTFNFANQPLPQPISPAGQPTLQSISPTVQPSPHPISPAGQPTLQSISPTVQPSPHPIIPTANGFTGSPGNFNQAVNSSSKEIELIFFDTSKHLANSIVLALICNGLGHIYIGQALKGITIFFASAFISIIAFAMESAIGEIIAIAFVIGSFIDLVMVYKKLKKGLAVKEWEFFAK